MRVKKKKKPTLARDFITLAGAVWVCACSSTPSPPEVYSGSVSRTLMFPLVDQRVDRTPAITKCDPERPMRDTAVMMSGLTKLSFAVDQGITSDVSRADLDAPNAEKLKQITRGDNQYVAFLFLEEFDQTASFKYKLTGYIVRPETGELVWHHTNEDSAWQGVLAGPLNIVGGMVDIGGMSMTVCQALHMVARNTFVNLPPLTAH